MVLVKADTAAFILINNLIQFEMQLAIYKYEDGEAVNDFTTIEIDGQPWFVAAEVCSLLGIKNVSDAMLSLDDDEKTTSVIPRGSRNVKANLINESGLYNLIFRSKKESAKKFRKWVTREVIPAIRKTGSFGINRLETPNFVVRYNENWERVERGYFSVISELFVRLYGRFHFVGYQIPNKAFDGKEIRPDGSVGIMFAKYLREKHTDKSESFKYYKHRFPSGIEVDAKQYPIELLPLFIIFVDEHWIPKCAPKYFNDRDKVALDYLPKLLAA